MELTGIRILTILVTHRRLIFGLGFVMGFIQVMATLVEERTYTSSAAIIPVGSRTGQSTATALAAQFGVNLEVGEPTRSPLFYADLLESREILRSIATDTFVIGIGSPEPRQLFELLEIDVATPRDALHPTIRWLREAVETNTDRETGVVRFTVVTPDSVLSEQIAERLIARINQFNLERRQNQAEQELSFISERLRVLETELREAERRMATFLDNNRMFENSPQLLFEHDRLQREINQKHQVHAALAQSLEQSRIESVRNTPVIAVVERPDGLTVRNSRGVILKGILGLLFGCLFGVLFALLREYWQYLRGEPAAEELREELEEAAQPLRRLRRSAE